MGRKNIGDGGLPGPSKPGWRLPGCQYPRKSPTRERATPAMTPGPLELGQTCSLHLPQPVPFFRTPFSLVDPNAPALPAFAASLRHRCDFYHCCRPHIYPAKTLHAAARGHANSHAGQPDGDRTCHDLSSIAVTSRNDQHHKFRNATNLPPQCLESCL